MWRCGSVRKCRRWCERGFKTGRNSDREHLVLVPALTPKVGSEVEVQLTQSFMFWTVGINYQESNCWCFCSKAGLIPTIHRVVMSFKLHTILDPILCSTPNLNTDYFHVSGRPLLQEIKYLSNLFLVCFQWKHFSIIYCDPSVSGFLSLINVRF